MHLVCTVNHATYGQTLNSNGAASSKHNPPRGICCLSHFPSQSAKNGYGDLGEKHQPSVELSVTVAKGSELTGNSSVHLNQQWQGCI